MPKPKARDLNELIRYTMWSVFRVHGPGATGAAGERASGGRDGLAAEVSELCQQAAGKDVGHARLLRRAGAAGRRRLHVLVDRAVGR